MADAMVEEQVSSSQSLELRDRRRPGRPASVSPTLVPLLRRPLPDAAAATALLAADRLFEADASDDEQDRFHDLAPARGIVMGVLFSLPIWGLIVMIVRAVL